MDLTHQPYPKIPTRAADDQGGEWIATEKIHGANFTAATDGREVRFGKRKAWLEPSDSFFGWQALRPLLERAALHAARAFGVPLRLYGELYGGAYPHPDVDAIPGLVPVQTGIYYCPDVRFALFDVVVENTTFLAHEEVVALAVETGLDAPPVLARGERRNLAQRSERFATLVPVSLGLPALENNLAEGWVLKPAGRAPLNRPVRKKKIEEFQELRFNEAAALNPHAHLSLPELLAFAATLMNPARIASARSKVGTTPEDIVDEAVLDALVDLEAILPRAFASLAPDESQSVEEALRERAAALCPV
ncbi:MAG: RNA ligase family protein [Myxococcota bacterium]